MSNATKPTLVLLAKAEKAIVYQFIATESIKIFKKNKNFFLKSAFLNQKTIFWKNLTKPGFFLQAVPGEVHN